MSNQDDAFIRNCTIILATLFVFFLLSLFVARAIGANAFNESRLTPGETAKRIEPIGQLVFGETGQIAPAQEEAILVTVAAAPKSANDVYQSACIACHSTGAAGAPKMGKAADWTPRLGQGLTALINNAINGKGVMPAKGGNPTLTDEEVELAVKFMLEKSSVTVN